MKTGSKKQLCSFFIFSKDRSTYGTSITNEADTRIGRNIEKIQYFKTESCNE